MEQDNVDVSKQSQPGVRDRRRSRRRVALQESRQAGARRFSMAAVFGVVLTASAALSLAAPLGVTAAAPASRDVAVASSAVERSRAAGRDWPVDQLIVQYRTAPTAGTKDGELPAGLLRSARSAGVTMRVLRTNSFGALVIGLDRPLTPGQARNLSSAVVASDPDVEFAEPDVRFTPASTPDDAEFPGQWSLLERTAGINVPSAWDLAKGGGVRVAVVDNGYRPHADLAQKIVGGYDFVSDVWTANDGNGRDGDASDPGDGVKPQDPVAVERCLLDENPVHSSWHGTHVAGIVAAMTDNGNGIAGVAPEAQIVPVRALGRCGGTMSDIADAVLWAAGGKVPGAPVNGHPARVVNASLSLLGTCPRTMQKAVTAARRLGSVVVAAAGNDYGLDAFYKTPASCQGVVTVAAVNRAGALTSYSNVGNQVDLAAPGGDGVPADRILSTANSGAFDPAGDALVALSGTSQATPHVSGVAALMLSAVPTLTADEVEWMLKISARPFPATCDDCGNGLLDARAAVKAALAGIPLLKEKENNSTAQTAQTVPSLVRVAGRLATAADVDWYRVAGQANDSVVATVKSGADGDADLGIFDPRGTLLSESTAGRGKPDQAQVSLARASDLYIRVARKAGTVGSYTLRVTP